MQAISINKFCQKKHIGFSLKWLILLFLILLLGLTATYMLGNYYNDNFNRKNNTEDNGNSSNNNSSNNNSTEIKVDADAEKDMHQLGKHFNKHGRSMKYASKKEYQKAAVKFAEKYKNSPNSNIFKGKWNGSGKFNLKEQFIINSENRTLIIDKISGQIVDFYEGAEMRGLINILKIY